MAPISKKTSTLSLSDISPLSGLSIPRLKGSIKNVELKARPLPNAKSGKSLDDEVLHDAIEAVISNSLYQQDDKQRLYTAIRATVKGELPLTQAAAQYAIPFSTVHPYVKKLRIDLGLAEADQYGRRSRSQKAKKNAASVGSTTAEAASKLPTPIKKVTKGERGKRALPPGYVPFKQISIPDQWRQFPDKMEEAVWAAVSNCHYDDEEKRHRLCSAVMEVMSGSKTIKASSCANEVPFTTLQTYFHRSRARMEQLMSGEALEVYSERSENDTPTMVKIEPLLDSNHDEPENLVVSVPLMEDNLTLSLSGPPSSSQSSTTSNNRPRRKEISSIVSRLIAQAEEQEDCDESRSGSPIALLTGSKRRKPQVVQKVEEGEDGEEPLPSSSKSTKFTVTGLLEKKEAANTAVFSSINALI